MKNIPSNFDKPLAELDSLLKERGLTLNLTIVGAFALNLLEISGQFTRGVDSVTSIDNLMIKGLIAEVGLKYQLSDDWINDAASYLDLPDGFFERIKRVEGYSNICLNVANRIDLIGLKARAYIHRGEIDSKDLEDLKRLKPTRDEIEGAIEFIRKTSTPPEADLFPDFEVVIEEIRRVAT